MDFTSLVGKTFQEKEFYELLLFELEVSFEKHFSKCIHFYFDRTKNGLIKITEMSSFKDPFEMDKINRSMIEKKEWFEFYQVGSHLNLLLCRFDRSGLVSSIRKDLTRTQEWRHGWADEEAYEPMTPEEIREGFQELAGYFENQHNQQKLKSKKAI